MLKVGLIGHGHFGQALVVRFKECNFEAELLISGGRGKNNELAEQCDVLILTVRPLQLAALAEEIRETLTRRGAAVQVLCFAAATPLEALEEAFGHPVLRAMADLQLEQVLAFSNLVTNPLLSALSKNPLIRVTNEDSLEAYTILVACLWGVVAWQVIHRAPQAEEWLNAYVDFIRTRVPVPRSLLEAIVEQAKGDPDPQGTMERMATPGGITESLLQQLGQKSDSSPEEVYEAGKIRTEAVRAAAGKSLQA